MDTKKSEVSSYYANLSSPALSNRSADWAVPAGSALPSEKFALSRAGARKSKAKA